MASLTEIRDAIRTVIEANVDDVMVYPRVPAAVEPKCVVVVPRSADTTTMGRGSVSYSLELIVVASSADTVSGQMALDVMLETDGAKIFAAFDANKTLGLDNTNIHAGGWEEYGTTDFNERAYYTATIPVVVVTKGN